MRCSATLGRSSPFHLGPKDAGFIGLEFQQKLEPLDLNLPNYHIYLKLMIGGMPSPPFSAETLAPDYL
jgi:hypothetical protein